MDILSKAGSKEDIAKGTELIASGKVGCIVLAGGEGSRLGWKGPKGTFPIENNKTLFQLILERYEKASILYGNPLKLALMTSESNHSITRSLFPHQIDVFKQRSLPFLNVQKQPLEQRGPNGNGEVLHCFYESGVYEKWKRDGIEYIQVIPVDNPLAEPYDPNQIGIHFGKHAEVTLKVVKKESAGEKVGVVGLKNGKVCVIEYSENPSDNWDLANTGLFSFDMSFVEKVRQFELPIHFAKKQLYGTEILKQECFIFDLLNYSNHTELILYQRDEVFAPLKSLEDIERVRKALYQG